MTTSARMGYSSYMNKTVQYNGADIEIQTNTAGLTCGYIVTCPDGERVPLQLMSLATKFIDDGYPE